MKTSCLLVLLYLTSFFISELHKCRGKERNKAYKRNNESEDNERKVYPYGICNETGT